MSNALNKDKKWDTRMKKKPLYPLCFHPIVIIFILCFSKKKKRKQIVLPHNEKV